MRTAPYTFLFSTHIKTTENPEIRNLIESENIILFQEEREELR